MAIREKLKIAGFVLATAGTVAVTAIEFAQHPIAFPCVLTAAVLGLGALSLKRRSERQARVQEAAVEKTINRIVTRHEHRTAAIAEALDVTVPKTLANQKVTEALQKVNSGSGRDSFELASAVRQRLEKGEALTPELVSDVKNTLKIQKGR